MKQIRGVIAAGHELTVRAGEEILLDGGNAFDAVVAAHFAACITEPVLSSLAGGGFLLAEGPDRPCSVYDFFAHTPCRRRPQEEVDFFPISADFSEITQEFHVGLGSFATPGTVAGLFAIHRDLCTLPLSRLAEPAIRMAREGVVMNSFQSYIFHIVRAIYLAYPDTFKRFQRPERPGTVEGSDSGSGTDSGIGSGTGTDSDSGIGSGIDPGTGAGSEAGLIREGDLLRQPELADAMESLAKEGEQLFYQGELAERMIRICRESGGHLTSEDLSGYRVIRRKPMQFRWRNTELAVNPAPSTGGPLIAFALQMLESTPQSRSPFGSTEALMTLARVQQLTDTARLENLQNSAQNADTDAAERITERILEPAALAAWKRRFRHSFRFNRGTTHISVMDAAGNTASLTTSNGEGCGRQIPDTGIMMNNMLGEEDLHPAGFQQWTENRRIASMMAPVIMHRSGHTTFTLGSGGSNRLRTAILQVIINLVQHQMPLGQAIASPRLHCERGFLNLEAGFDAGQLAPLLAEWPGHKIWSESNLFFGGTHTVCRSPEGFSGAGDPRRGGVSRVVS